MGDLRRPRWAGTIPHVTSRLDQTIGQNILLLADDCPSWLPRRVDSIECIDHAVARREVRVDIDLGNLANLRDEEEWPRWHGGLLLPLAALSRFGGHTEIAVVDESGSALPRLTKNEERRFALGAVELQARHVLDGSDVPDFLLQQLHHHLSTRDPDLEPDGLRGTDVGNRLIDDRRFRQTIRRLTGTYYLVVPVDPADGTRRVLTYSYYEHLNFSHAAQPLVQRLFTQIGVTRLEVHTPAAGDCTSFHLVMPCPYDIQVSEASLDLLPVDGKPVQCTDDDRLPTRVHLYASAASPLAAGSANVQLHLLPTGLVRSSVYSALFTVATLLIGTAVTVFAENHVFPSADTDAAVALLLLVPGVFGSTLATPSRHSMTTTLLFPTRLTLVIASLMSFVAAAVVALETEGQLAVLLWCVASLVAIVCTIILSAQLIRVHRLGSRSD